MKYFLCITILVFLSGCSNDSPLDDYPKNVDIEFSINSSDPSRYSGIQTVITAGVDQSGSYSIHIEEKSHGNHHLPYNRKYINQTVRYGTTLGISYTDDTGTISFEPYTINMTIRLNNDVVASEEFEVNERGMVLNTGFKLN